MDYKIKHLISEEGNFYKANLASHSTHSCGTKTPAELKSLYKKNGYSILAITDKTLSCYPELCDEDFLVLPALSFERKAEKLPATPQKCATFTAISLSEDAKVPEEFDTGYDSEKTNEILSLLKKRGFFLIYNHPIKNLELIFDYIKYEPLDALEIMDYSSLTEGYDEYNGIAYDNMLRRGRRLFAVASDKNKNLFPEESERFDSFGAYTVIKAKRLDIPSIGDALNSGSFYSTEGPEIKKLWIKGSTVNVRTSPTDRIILTAGRRGCKCVYANEFEPLTAASFKISPDDVYFRIVVIDKDGRRAYSNAYFIDDLIN